MPSLRGAPPLPIDAILPSVLDVLASGRSAVVVAAPGAGKTTRLPLALLDAPWRAEGRILVLEPRRIAARAAAQQMAALLGEDVGATVGYRVRLESRVSSRTRVEVVTEGILTRMVQDDPSLDGIAALCFDEFHERHLASDLGLALALESRAVLRPDLRLIVMSATLEAAPVARLLADGGTDAPVIVSEGRAHPVTTHFRPLRDGVPMARSVAQGIRRVLGEADGDVLVFLPGIAELSRVRDALSEESDLGAIVQLLHGTLSLAEQDAVLRPREPRRRVVLSTAIAESSVTLDGVRVVVDAGLARVPRYDPRSGMTRLETVRVSQASADQRRGRAGRTAPGVCVRLWDEGTQASLPVRAIPELLESDLTPLALELACAGIADATQLRWLDAPPAGALAQGRALLRDLGALDANGRVTSHGRAMAGLGIAPRLAHLVLTGAARGEGRLACEIAALLAERDILRRDAAEFDADLRTRVEVLRGARRGEGASHGRDVADRARLERVRAEAKALGQALRSASPRTGERVADASRGGASRADASQREDALDGIGALVALAYPDRLARRRAGEAPRYQLRNGRGARFALPQPLGHAPFLAIADLDGDPAESRIWLASPLTESELRDAAGAALITERVVGWDDSADEVVAVERERVGAIILKERPLRDVQPHEMASALTEAVRRRGLEILTWNAPANALRARLAFAYHVESNDFPNVSDDGLITSLEHWLLPALVSVRRRADLARVDIAEALLASLPWSARSRLDRLAPTHLEVPSGSRIAIDYGDPAQPMLAVKLQEVFGLLETPRVGEGRVPVTMQLLSPAGRPAQVTRDLASFWRTGYFDVRKDLKGRYPRHPWPDDPLAANPTRRVKPRGT